MSALFAFARDHCGSVKIACLCECVHLCECVRACISSLVDIPQGTPALSVGLMWLVSGLISRINRRLPYSGLVPFATMLA